MLRLPKILSAGLIVAAFLATDALGCPNCKDALANDPAATALVQGYFWSILFMLAMPFTIFVGMSTYFYLLVRRARLDAAAGQVAGRNPFAPANAGQAKVEAEQEEMLV